MISNSIAMLVAASTLSSTTKTRRLIASVAADPATGGASNKYGASTSSGKYSTNSLPWPRPSLCTVTEPPCISTRFFTKVRPIPSPPWVRSSEVSTCLNISKMRDICSGAMPTPLSVTRITTCPLAVTTDSPIRPPRSVNFAALLSKLPIICAILVGSTFK